jgi:hypothetical protein
MLNRLRSTMNTRDYRPGPATKPSSGREAQEGPRARTPGNLWAGRDPRHPAFGLKRDERRSAPGKTARERGSVRAGAERPFMADEPGPVPTHRPSDYTPSWEKSLPKEV